MVFEKFIRYIRLAVGLKPSATECEARLRGLERIIFQRPYFHVSRPCGFAAQRPMNIAWERGRPALVASPRAR